MNTYTSAAANKMLRNLDDEKQYLLEMEQDAATYILTEGEHTAPPEYDYQETQRKLEIIEGQIRTIKHAINVFNTTTVLDEVGVTIDGALVEMAQLNRTKRRLDIMRKRLPKARCNDGYYGGSKNLVEYRYVNYDLAEVTKDYETISNRIMALQMALDLANQTLTFQI